MKHDADADIKDEILRSMSLPWTPRPSYRTNAINTTPTGARKDRRVKKVRRLYWHLREDLGILTICFAIFGVGVLLWLALAQMELWLR